MHGHVPGGCMILRAAFSLGTFAALALLVACSESQEGASPVDPLPRFEASCGIPPCGSGASRDKPKLLARWRVRGSGGGTHSTRVFNPAGVAVCLIHERSF